MVMIFIAVIIMILVLMRMLAIIGWMVMMSVWSVMVMYVCVLLISSINIAKVIIRVRRSWNIGYIKIKVVTSTVVRWSFLWYTKVLR